MMTVFDKLKHMFKVLSDMEFELRQYEMVMESGGLTEEEVAHLAEGPTLAELREYQTNVTHQINTLLKEGFNSDSDIVEVQSQ